MLRLVKNGPEYFEFIRNLRNNEIVKKGFIVQKYITKEEQASYMEKYGDNYFICLYEEMPAGYIGVINKDIRLAVAPEYQGKGIGEYMVKSFIKDHPDSVAIVKVDNEASLKLFRKCGFKEKFIIFGKE